MRFRFVLFFLWIATVTMSIATLQVRFVGDLSYVPFEILESDGQAKGYFVDFWRLAGKKAGFSVTYELCQWKDALAGFEKGDFDVVGGIFYSEQRSKRYLFSKPFLEIPTSVFYRSHIDSIVSLRDLQKYRVGVVEQDYSQEYLERNAGKANLVLYPTTEALVLAAIEGEISVFLCDEPVALYWLKAYSKAQDFKISPPFYKNFVYAVVRPDQKELLDLLNRGIDLITEEEQSNLESTWFGVPKTHTIPWALILVLSLIAFGVLISVFIWNSVLRRRIEAAIRTIKEQNERLSRQNLALTENEQQFEGVNQQLLATTEDLEKTLLQVEGLNYTMFELIELSKLLSEAAQGKDQTFFEKLLNTTLTVIPSADYGSVSLFEGEDWRFVYAIGHDLANLKTLRLKKSQFTLEGKISVVEDIISDNRPKMNATELEKLAQFTKPIAHSIVIGLFIGESLVGGISIDISAYSDKRFTQRDTEVAQALSNLASGFLAMQRYTIAQGKFQKDLLMGMIKILEIYDPHTKGHSENVASLSARFAEELGISSDLIQRIYWAGLVHDIGKILVSRELLGKMGPLTSSEYQIIQNHPVWGAEVLQSSDELSDIVLYIRHHHERWDGNGYPNRLEGESIPFVSRIISLADSYDAMISDRPYRKKKTVECALKDILNNAGKQFDPSLAKAFCAMIEGKSAKRSVI
ncbi:MAG TPA: transporter substrate-binding domain-containing protein [Thermotogota bacterium]|jgi:putative nucleotidyltransferase with HDIG domain|nr:MAG: Cyclic di-GMP phosphodiesterase response regulator RpfG [Thermotogota bacterium ADurb.Bin062]HNY83063.1 transporter substrate-binding domain-containing protein [Thermotogota bacterium]HOD91555.1 transporter substrate-binding domain-containing protein [Thermotogota bacterium]HOF24121.1 transporter substrate-binding domain-containing protein [Thermotogota bacterium]HOS25458.1 transporter substrate-binding domain-containing protein [Thermotogota bacterium]